MLYRRAIFVDEMRILCRIIGGSHTIKSYSKLTPSTKHLAAEQKCAVADLLQGLTLYNNSNDKDGFARARLLLQVIKAMGL